MEKHTMLFALFCGIGFSAACVLLLNVPVPVLPALLSLLLSPGALAGAALTDSRAFGPPLVVLVANSLLYSSVAYIITYSFGLNKQLARVHSAATKLALPAIALVCAASIPSLNPLWPRGMAELAREESDLQTALPVGTALSQGRSILASKGIKYDEETQSSEAVVVEREGKKLTAFAGDQVLSSRFRTGAAEFPCGYEMEVFLLFGRDDRLRDRYVHRLRVCP